MQLATVLENLKEISRLWNKLTQSYGREEHKKIHKPWQTELQLGAKQPRAPLNKSAHSQWFTRG
jgi:hypothetical protein